MAVLLIAEHDNVELKDSTAKALSAAAEIGGDVHILVTGMDCAAVGEAAAKLTGVAKVLVADDELYEHRLGRTDGRAGDAADGKLRYAHRGGDHDGQKFYAAGSCAAGRDADF